MSSSSEITIVEWVLGEMTDARGAGGSTMAGATDAFGPTETTDAVVARAVGGCTMACADADALKRSNSMKCV